jgi:hypothetical protein
MKELWIPERRRAGLSLIQNLNVAAARDICTLMERGAESALREAQALRPNSSFASLSAEELESLVSAVVELYRVWAGRDASVQEFAEGITEAMLGLEEEKYRVPDSNSEEFQQKLEIILGAEEMSLTSKAKNIAIQDERTFCSARIMTELRPVFSDGSTPQPRAMVLAHRLKIKYHAGSSEHKEFYLALDTEDLKELRKLIDRAEAEAKSLESILPDFHLFGVGGPDTK